MYRSTLLSSILTLCTPLFADSGYAWIYALRVLLGFFHGVTFPLLQGLWNVWGPPLERTKLIAIYNSGIGFGTCLILPIGGFLANSSLGRRSIFYLTGAVGILWSILWLYIAYDTTAKHPRSICMTAFSSFFLKTIALLEFQAKKKTTLNQALVRTKLLSSHQRQLHGWPYLPALWYGQWPLLILLATGQSIK